MSDAARYPYAEGALLDEPNTYSYTPYLGRPFLDAWQAARRAVLAELPPPAAGPRPKKCICPSLKRSFETAELFQYLMFVLESTASLSEVQPLVDKILQRFEISKRVHCRYTATFRPEASDAFKNMELYLLFAELMLRAYDVSGELSYLNGLLKCVDTLCAVRIKLAPSERCRLARLIQCEVERFESLRSAMGRI